MIAIIHEIIASSKAEVKVSKARLEVEENGREVASLQGKLAGYKKLIDMLCAVFSLEESFIKAVQAESRKMADLEDEELFNLSCDIQLLEMSQSWEQFKQKLDWCTEEQKNFLLFSAEKSRDLDVCQGIYTATMEWERIFNAVKAEATKRTEKAEKERSEPDLPFN